MTSKVRQYEIQTMAHGTAWGTLNIQKWKMGLVSLSISLYCFGDRRYSCWGVGGGLGGGERDTVGLVAGPPPLLVFLVKIIFNVLAEVSETCQVRADIWAKSEQHPMYLSKILQTSAKSAIWVNTDNLMSRLRPLSPSQGNYECNWWNILISII